MAIHWPLVLFTLFTGLGVGAFACVAVLEWLDIGDAVLLPGTITVLAAMAVGGVAAFLHLSHPFRSYHIVKHLNTGVGKEMLLISITGAAIFLYAVSRFLSLPDFILKILTAVGLISGIILAFEMGATYILPARPAWRTWLWAFIYAASASATGLFTIYVWAAALRTRVEESFILGINKGALIALIVQVGVILAYLMYLASSPSMDLNNKPARLLKGDGAIPFWGGVVLAGMLIPMAMTIWVQVGQATHLASFTAGVGLVCVLLGGIAIRALMYKLGEEIELIL